MSRTISRVITLLSLALAATLAGFELSQRLSESDPVMPLPTFQMASLADLERQLSPADFTGEVALLNVWASWCAPCRQEHALLLSISETGLPIHGVNFTDDRRAALYWLEKLGNPYTANVFDERGQLAMSLGAMGVPETYLLDEQAQIRYKHRGLLDEQTWQAEFLPRIQRLRAEADTP